MFVWGPSADALFGAFVAGSIALLAVVAERRAAEKARRIQKLERLSSLGFSLQVKITQAYSWCRSVDTAISECFRDRPQDIGHTIDPGVAVKPLVGMRAPDLSFSAEELALVLETGDAGLVERLLSLQWQVATLAALIDKFNQSRSEYSIFLADIASSGDFITSDTAQITVPVTKKHSEESRRASLNVMVGEMIEELPKHRQACPIILRRVVTALSSIQGIAIHDVKIDEK